MYSNKVDLLEAKLGSGLNVTSIAAQISRVPQTWIALVFAIIFFGFASRVLSEIQLVTVIRTLDLIALLVMGAVYLALSTSVSQSQVVLLR